MLFLLSMPVLLFDCHPKTSAAYYKLAMRKYKKENNRLLVDSLLKASVKLDSTNHRAYCMLAENLPWDTAHLALKRRYYLKAISYDSVNGAYYLYYAQTYTWHAVKYQFSDSLKTDDNALQKAIEICSRGIAHDSLSAGLYGARAYCNNYTGDTAACKRDLLKASSLGDVYSAKLAKLWYRTK